MLPARRKWTIQLEQANRPPGRSTPRSAPRRIIFDSRSPAPISKPFPNAQKQHSSCKPKKKKKMERPRSGDGKNARSQQPCRKTTGLPADQQKSPKRRGSDDAAGSTFFFWPVKPRALGHYLLHRRDRTAQRWPVVPPFISTRSRMISPFHTSSHECRRRGAQHPVSNAHRVTHKYTASQATRFADMRLQLTNAHSLQPWCTLIRLRLYNDIYVAFC